MDLRVKIGITIGNVADEDDINTTGLRDKEVIELLAKMVSIASKKIKAGIDLNRFKGEIKILKNEVIFF